MWDTLYEALTPEQWVEWDLLEVPEGSRISELERWLRLPGGPRELKVVVIKRRSGALLQVKSL